MSTCFCITIQTQFIFPAANISLCQPIRYVRCKMLHMHKRIYIATGLSKNKFMEYYEGRNNKKGLDGIQAL